MPDSIVDLLEDILHGMRINDLNGVLCVLSLKSDIPHIELLPSTSIPIPPRILQEGPAELQEIIEGMMKERLKMQLNYIIKSELGPSSLYMDEVPEKEPRHKMCRKCGESRSCRECRTRYKGGRPRVRNNRHRR